MTGDRSGVMRWKRRLAWMAMVGLMLAGSLEAQGGPLDGLVREALESSRAVEQARLAVRQQEASVREASGMLGPSVTVHARYSESTGTINFGDLVNPAYQALNQITGTGRYPTDVDARLPLAQETKVSVVQPLFQPALSSNARIQRNLRELRGSSLRGAIRSLAAEVQLAYLSYARSVRAVELYRETLSLLQENVRVNESLLANGKMTPDALFRARAEKSGMEQQILETERESAAARRYLNLLLERPLDAQVELLPDSLLDFPLRLTLDEALLSARKGREELEQVNLRVRVAEVERRLARASFLPSVSLALDYGIQGSDYRFDAEHDFAVLSVVTQWNAFNGGQTAARGERAALEARSASTRHEELEREIMLQVHQAYDATTVAYSAIATAEDRLVAARRTYELVERRYREGMAPHIEYVQARTEYTTAALNRILTGYQYALRYVELERAAALREVEP